MIAFIQDVNAPITAYQTPPLSATFASDVTAGNLILLMVSAAGSPTLNDNQGNIYTQLFTKYGNTLYMTVANQTGSLTITLDGYNLVYGAIKAWEYSGVNTLDQSNVADTTTQNSTISTPSSTTADDELVVGAIIGSTNFTTIIGYGSGYTGRTGVGTPYSAEGWIQDKVVNTTGVQTSSFSLNVPFTDYGYPATHGIFTFKYVEATNPCVKLRGKIKLRGKCKIR